MRVDADENEQDPEATDEDAAHVGTSGAVPIQEELVLFAVHEVEPDVVNLVLPQHILVRAHLHTVPVAERLFRKPRQVRPIGQHYTKRRLIPPLLFRLLVL